MRKMFLKVYRAVKVIDRAKAQIIKEHKFN